MEDWERLAAEEKDPERVRLLIEKLIEALSEEQQRVQDDIEARLPYSAKAARNARFRTFRPAYPRGNPDRAHLLMGTRTTLLCRLCGNTELHQS